jgi:hypothetical protein
VIMNAFRSPGCFPSSLASIGRARSRRCSDLGRAGSCPDAAVVARCSAGAAQDCPDAAVPPRSFRPCQRTPRCGKLLPQMRLAVAVILVLSGGSRAAPAPR